MGPEGIKFRLRKNWIFLRLERTLRTELTTCRCHISLGKPPGTGRVLWILVLVYINGMLLFSSFALAPELLCCWSFQWFYYKNPPHQKRVFKWLHQCGVSASLHRSNSAADALSSANAPASQANKLVLPPLEFSSCEPLNFKQCKHVMFHNWKFQDWKTLQLCTLRLQSQKWRLRGVIFLQYIWKW